MLTQNVYVITRKITIKYKRQFGSQLICLPLSTCFRIEPKLFICLQTEITMVNNFVFNSSGYTLQKKGKNPLR